MGRRSGNLETCPSPRACRFPGFSFSVAANVSWSMDFVSDGLADGRRVRCLTIVDDWNRECLAIEVDTSITGRRVVGVLERLADLRGLPASITVDHGPEFEGQLGCRTREGARRRPHDRR